MIKNLCWKGSCKIRLQGLSMGGITSNEKISFRGNNEHTDFCKLFFNTLLNRRKKQLFF